MRGSIDLSHVATLRDQGRYREAIDWLHQQVRDQLPAGGDAEAERELVLLRHYAFDDGPTPPPVVHEPAVGGPARPAPGNSFDCRPGPFRRGGRASLRRALVGVHRSARQAKCDDGTRGPRPRHRKIDSCRGHPFRRQHYALLLEPKRQTDRLRLDG